MTTITISLDSKTDVFFPNSEVNGTLFVTTNDPDSLKRINVSIVGCARTYFKADNSDIFEAEQFYLNMNKTLWRNEETPNGEIQLPIKFVIPSDAAPNISEKLGEIQYYIKAHVELDTDLFWKKNEVEYYYGFSVCPCIDLNLNPKLKLNAYDTVTQIKRKYFWSATNRLKVKMSLPKTGFVCGEIIPLQIDISNKTYMKIKYIDFGILVYCIGRGSRKGETKGVGTSTTVVKNSIAPTADSINCEIVIPALSPSYSECSLLKIKYFVFVKVHTDACFKSGPSTCIPITIGNIPMIEGEVDAMKVLENADFVEGVARCRIRKRLGIPKRKKDGPKEFRPKFPYYSDLSFIEKPSYDSSSIYSDSSSTSK